MAGVGFNAGSPNASFWDQWQVRWRPWQEASPSSELGKVQEEQVQPVSKDWGGHVFSLPTDDFQNSKVHLCRFMHMWALEKSIYNHLSIGKGLWWLLHMQSWTCVQSCTVIPIRVVWHMPIMGWVTSKFWDFWVWSLWITSLQEGCSEISQSNWWGEVCRWPGASPIRWWDCSGILVEHRVSTTTST